MACDRGARGTYKIVQILDIAESLASQIEKESANNHDSIFKAAVEQDGAHSVLYFAGPLTFGPGSTVELLHKLAAPILFPGDYKVVQSVPYSHNHALVAKLLEENRKSKL
ncbi:hypothetical protein PAPHI01_1615 [Pancytospora philotis]|nr:hypothetical protein PAPHI01_1615 [Pancytospora philotis]